MLMKFSQVFCYLLQSFTIKGKILFIMLMQFSL